MNDLESNRVAADLAKTRLKTRAGQVRQRLLPAMLVGAVRQSARKRLIQTAAIAATSKKGRTALAIGAIGAGLVYLFKTPMLKAITRQKVSGDKK